MPDFKRQRYVQELIRTALQDLSIIRSRVKREHEDRFRTLLPYTFHRKNNLLLPLNRDYKPLGLMHFSSFVDYEKYEFLTIPMSELNFDDEEIIKANERNDRWMTFRFYFFNDITVPWETMKDKKKYIHHVKRVFNLKNDRYNGGVGDDGYPGMSL